MKMIESIPPFSWLHELAKNAEKGLNYVIDMMNTISKKMGGPSVVIPITIGLLAILVEYQFKGAAKHGIIWVAELITANPAFATILTALAYIATTIAGIHAIDKIAGGKIMGH